MVVVVWRGFGLVLLVLFGGWLCAVGYWWGGGFAPFFLAAESVSLSGYSEFCCVDR